jgi:hypothetical protein
MHTKRRAGRVCPSPGGQGKEVLRLYIETSRFAIPTTSYANHQWLYVAFGGFLGKKARIPIGSLGMLLGLLAQFMGG